MTAARERTAADQLLLDQAVIWLDRNAAACALQMRAHPDWRQAAAQVVDAFAVIYLLALLRETDPAAADRAARFLNAGAGGRNLPQFISDWQYAIATDQPLGLP